MQTDSAKSGRVTQAVFSVCVADDVAQTAMEAVSAVLGSEFIGQFQEYITAEKRPHFPDVLKEADGCVALIDCDRDQELALETMERLQQTFPQRLHLVAISTRTDSEFLLRAMRSGCDDFLVRPLDQTLLTSALKRFQKGNLVEALNAKGKGKVISMFGVKGGVGTTTLAVHLAMHLVRRHRKRVLLIDHKDELGHVALHLGMKESVYHFDELVRNADRLDSDLLDGFVTRHPSGLEVIPSPDACSPSHEASPEAIGRVMEYLRTRYDFILIDSSLQSVSQLTAIMTASDEVSLVCTPDVASLRDLVRRIEHLSLIAGFTAKLRVVINRSTSDDAVSPEDIQTAVRFPISVAIPNNYANLMRAINAGEPIPPQRRGGFTQTMAQWANRIAADPSSESPKLSQASKASAPEPKRRFRFSF